MYFYPYRLCVGDIVEVNTDIPKMVDNGYGQIMHIYDVNTQEVALVYWDNDTTFDIYTDRLKIVDPFVQAWRRMYEDS